MKESEQFQPDFHSIVWVKDQNGVAIFIVLLVMSLLLVIGVALIGVSNTEVGIARNEHFAVRKFFASEASTVEGCVAIENESPSNLKTHSPDWLTWPGDTGASFDQTDPDQWDFDGVGGDDNAEAMIAINEPGYRGAYTVNEDGIAGGTSLDMTKPQLRAFAVWGLFEKYRGGSRTEQKMLEVGYLRRF